LSAAASDAGLHLECTHYWRFSNLFDLLAVVALMIFSATLLLPGANKSFGQQA
jgi:hypothetical protein